MRWPLRSAAAYDLALAQLDKAEARIDVLTDALIRLQRKDMGMTEAPREQHKAPEPVPSDVVKYLDGFADPRIRRATLQTMCKANMAGKPWQQILQDEVAPKEEGTP